MRRWLALAVIAGCTNNVDPAWQLDHERIIAVRATPDRIAAGESAAIDALIGHKGAPPEVVDPDSTVVISPASLASSLSRSGSHWIVTTPPADQLDAARTELALDAGAPVPLRVQVSFDATGLQALKIVWLGEHADNPAIGPISIDGADATAQTQLAVAPGVNIPVQVDLDSSFIVTWLTSCGTMHDFDLPKAYLRVEADDPHSGTFAIVVRDQLGGVAWQLWPITAE